MNRDQTSSKLQQMKEEITLLREELVRAKMETNLLTSKAKSNAGIEETCQGEDSNRPMTSDCDVKLKENMQGKETEERLAKAQLKLQSYACCLRTVREKLTDIVSDGEITEQEVEDGVKEREEERAEEERNIRGTGGLGKEEEKILKECLKILRSCDDVGSEELGLVMNRPISSKAAETISLLRTELVRCHQDLQTDEQAFAEKIEEITELQSVCHALSRDKERAEAMWLATQESEAELQMQVEELLRKLAELKKGGRREEVGVVMLEDSLVEEGVKTTAEEMGVTEGCGEVVKSGYNEDSIREEKSLNAHADSLTGGVALPREGQPSLSPEEERFKATRSLILGKVKTDSLEVRQVMEPLFAVYRGVLISGEEFHCIQRCPHFRVLD